MDITFVQDSCLTTPTSTNVVSVPYESAQTLYNLNAVTIGWADNTSSVTSVYDTNGNAYIDSGLGTQRTVGVSQSIWYSPNIFSGSNTVTVTFNSFISGIDVRIAEFSGVSSVDCFSGSIGNTLNLDSGPITTSNANDLIYCAATTTGHIITVGSGFIQIINILNGFLNIHEYQIVNTIGTYHGTCSQDVSYVGNTVCQVVAFKASSASVTQNYAIISSDRSSVLTVMEMDSALKNNMMENRPDLILLPVNMIAKPSFVLATQVVVQSGWTIGPVDVQPVWLVISQTPDQMVVSAAQLYYNTVTPGIVQSFTSALSNWGSQTSLTKDALLVQLLNSVNAILQCKFGLQLPIALSISGSLGVTGEQQINKLFISFTGAINATGLISLGLDPKLTGIIGLSGVLTL